MGNQYPDKNLADAHYKVGKLNHKLLESMKSDETSKDKLGLSCAKLSTALASFLRARR